MSKKMCEKDKTEKDGKYVCKKCGRKSEKEKHVCKPQKDKDK